MVTAPVTVCGSDDRVGTVDTGFGVATDLGVATGIGVTMEG
ncbi:hypothetical protein BSU04_01190 [Caballeronia sordidicola]|uniref:Uncharacterized protein n=1 Tax=Caballeronia sordidicola TaxID=196367 RepID=A0A226XBT6_CABSO|nr:hypothetical protein BSU04_01190 [Caballeronia sordidicola]